MTGEFYEFSNQNWQCHEITVKMQVIVGSFSHLIMFLKKVNLKI